MKTKRKQMTKYRVRITEILCRDVYVEAATPEQAYNTVDDRYSSSDIILDYSDLVSTDIDAAVEVPDAEFYSADNIVEVTDAEEG